MRSFPRDKDMLGKDPMGWFEEREEQEPPAVLELLDVEGANPRKCARRAFKP